MFFYLNNRIFGYSAWVKRRLMYTVSNTYFKARSLLEVSGIIYARIANFLVNIWGLKFELNFRYCCKIRAMLFHMGHLYIFYNFFWKHLKQWIEKKHFCSIRCNISFILSRATALEHYHTFTRFRIYSCRPWFSRVPKKADSKLSEHFSTHRLSTNLARFNMFKLCRGSKQCRRDEIMSKIQFVGKPKNWWKWEHCEL